MLLKILSEDTTKEWFLDCVDGKGFGFLVNTYISISFQGNWLFHMSVEHSANLVVCNWALDFF